MTALRPFPGDDVLSAIWSEYSAFHQAWKS